LIYTTLLPVFCLLHGAWHGPDCWAPLAERLRTGGHEVIAPELPLHDPGAGYEERIRPALEALEKINATVVLVGHSLGSTYAAPIAARRSGCLLVHLCPRLHAFAPRPGGPDIFRADAPFPSSGSDGRSVWDPDAAIHGLYRRLAPAVARAAAQRLRPLATLAAPCPYPGRPEVPTALVYADDDELMEPAWQRFMAEELLGIEPIRIPGGHFPMLEDPVALADLLEGLAGERDQA
jgi:pimeloyl-ACP methyl ester carboxylesterase